MSITITITIDGGEVSATTVSPQSMTAVSSHIPTLSASSSEAMDAGSAPSEMELSSGMLGLPSPSEIEQSSTIREAGDTDAGAAPSFPPHEESS